jgi:hypothetical protein
MLPVLPAALPRWQKLSPYSGPGKVAILRQKTSSNHADWQVQARPPCAPLAIEVFNALETPTLRKTHGQG